MPPELADSVAQDVVKFLLGGGALAFAGAIGRFIWKWRTGRIAEEKANNTSLVNDRAKAVTERQDAERQRDEADRKRRIALDEVSRLRRMLIEKGFDPGEELDFAQTRKPKRSSRDSAAEKE